MARKTKILLLIASMCLMLNCVMTVAVIKAANSNHDHEVLVETLPEGFNPNTGAYDPAWDDNHIENVELRDSIDPIMTELSC